MAIPHHTTIPHYQAQTNDHNPNDGLSHITLH